MDPNNPKNWNYVFSNKYGSGNILTAIYGTGDDTLGFEIDPANLDQSEIADLESRFGQDVINAAILTAKNAERQAHNLNKSWGTKFS
jgi:hypothetical protein